MNIFLTGGSGFVGSHLLDELLILDHNIFILVRDAKKIHQTSDKIKLISGDLENGFELSAAELMSIDLIIHTAGIVHSFDTNDFYKVNLEGTKSLIQKFSNNLKLKFIFISSLAARGPFEQEFKDVPVSEYGKSKCIADQYLIHEAPKEWIKIIIRPPMVIGPKDAAVLDIYKMVKDGVVVLPGLNSKKKQYSFVCVFDLVNTILKCMDYHQSETFYSSFPESVSFENLIKEINKHIKKRPLVYLPIPKIIVKAGAQTLLTINKTVKLKLRLTPDKLNELFPARWVCDSKKTEELLSQKYEYDLSKTVKITFDDYKKRKWI